MGLACSIFCIISPDPFARFLCDCWVIVLCGRLTFCGKVS